MTKDDWDPNPFTHFLRVRYSECDAQRVVFNANYAEYVDIAATEYSRAIWGEHNKLLEQGIDNVVVSLMLNWRAPARFDDVIAIQVRSKKIGTTSFVLQLRFCKLGEKESLAEGEIAYVMIDTKTYKKSAIPESYRQALESAGPGMISNQSGLDFDTLMQQHKA